MPKNIITTEQDTADSQERSNNGHRLGGSPQQALGRFVNPGNRRIILSGGPDYKLRWASTLYGRQSGSVMRFVDFLVSRNQRLLALRRRDFPGLHVERICEPSIQTWRRRLVGSPAYQADRRARRSRAMVELLIRRRLLSAQSLAIALPTPRLVRGVGQALQAAGAV